MASSASIRWPCSSPSRRDGWHARSMAIPFETWGARPHEVDAVMPGDDLVDDPAMSATRAIDLDRPPAEAFGWLTQMGFGRAGWYSYDLIDNLGRRSARRIHPEWQVTRAGDAVPGGPVDFTAHIVDPPHTFVLSLLGQRLAGHRIDFTLAYLLRTGTALTAQPPVNATARSLPSSAAKPAPDPDARPTANTPTGPTADTDAQPATAAPNGQPTVSATDRAPHEHLRHEPSTRTDGIDEPSGSRLVCRARATIDGPARRLVVPLLCLGDGIMVRRQLLGLRERCAG